MLNLRTGAGLAQSIDVLNEAARSGRDVVGAGGGGVALFNRYLEWASRQERMLASLVTRDELERILATKRYWTIQSLDPIAYGPALTDLITLEVNARVDEFEVEVSLLEAERDLWNVASQASTFGDHLHAVVVDTNVLMTHRTKLEQADWSAIAGKHRLQSIGIAIPSIVVDELDNLKHTNGKMMIDGVNHERRWLATQALGWLEGAFPGVEQRVLLRRAAMTGASPLPELYAVLTSEPLSHIRLPKADSEIISRALALVPIAKSVTIASYDTNMIFAARRLGLHAVKMPQFHEPVPDDSE
jgi:hypothetical protein